MILLLPVEAFVERYTLTSSPLMTTVYTVSEMWAIMTYPTCTMTSFVIRTDEVSTGKRNVSI